MEKYKCLQIYIVEMLNKLVYPVTAVCLFSQTTALCFDRSWISHLMRIFRIVSHHLQKKTRWPLLTYNHAGPSLFCIFISYYIKYDTLGKLSKMLTSPANGIITSKAINHLLSSEATFQQQHSGL